MNRFNQNDIYRDVLDAPYGSRGHQRRAALPAREKKNKSIKLWHHNGLLRLMLAALLLGVVLLLVILVDDIETQEIRSRKTLSLACFTILCLAIVVLPIVWGIYTRKKFQGMMNGRCGMEDEEFGRQLEDATCTVGQISALRDVLGLVFNIDRDLIYPSDSLRSLCVNGNPIQFEIVLGYANRVGIELDDDKIDRIGKRIYDSANTVSDLINIMNNELCVCPAN